MKKQKEEIENQSADAAKNIINDQKGVVGISTQNTPVTPLNKPQQSLFKKLKLDTNVGKLIAFMLSFALIGGIYLAFRSFASTPTTLIKNGKLLVQESGNYGKYYLYDVETNESTVMNYLNQDATSNPKHRGEVKLSPNSNKVVWFNKQRVFNGSLKDRTIYVSNVDGSEIKEIASLGTSTSPQNIFWSLDGTEIFFNECPSSVTVCHLMKTDLNGNVTKLLDKSGLGYGTVLLRGIENKEKLLISTMATTNEAQIYYSYNYKSGGRTELKFDYNTDGRSGYEGIAPNPVFEGQYAGFVRSNHWGNQNQVCFETLKLEENIFRPDRQLACLPNELYFDKNILPVGNNTRGWSPWSPDGRWMSQINQVQNIDTGEVKKLGRSDFVVIDWQPFLEYFNPTGNTTRQAMAVFLYRVAGKPDVSKYAELCGEGKPGPFSDVTGTHAFCREIVWLSDSGIGSGFKDGTFKPGSAVTRQAMSAFLYRQSGGPAVPTANEKCGSGRPGPFSDVSGTHAFCKEIEWMRAQGISEGYRDGTYKPGSNVSRQAMSSFLYRANGSPTFSENRQLYVDVPQKHTFYQAIQWLATKR